CIHSPVSISYLGTRRTFVGTYSGFNVPCGYFHETRWLWMSSCRNLAVTRSGERIFKPCDHPGDNRNSVRSLRDDDARGSKVYQSFLSSRPLGFCSVGFGHPPQNRRDWCSDANGVAWTYDRPFLCRNRDDL